MVHLQVGYWECLDNTQSQWITQKKVNQSPEKLKIVDKHDKVDRIFQRRYLCLHENPQTVRDDESQQDFDICPPHARRNANDECIYNHINCTYISSRPTLYIQLDDL